MTTNTASGAADRAIEGCPELNMGNYDEVDAERLNDWAIRANDEINRLHALAAGQATAAQIGAYAALPESFLEIPDVQDESGINAYYSREVVLECIDAALASRGQAPAPADSVQEDAARWHWMAEYIVGTRTDLDDDLIASATVDELRKLVDADLAARKQGEKQ